MLHYINKKYTDTLKIGNRPIDEGLDGGGVSGIL